MQKGPSTILVLAAVAALAACSGEPAPRQQLASSAQLQPNPDRPSDLRYVNPNVDLKQYRRFMVDPVEIYKGADAQFGNTTPEQQREVAEFVRQEFERMLRQRYQVVSAPGPGVARLHFTLAGLEATMPVLATATHVAPAGLAMNVLKGATGSQGSFMGSVTLAGEFYDSMTNNLIGAVVTKRSANAMDVTSVFTGLDAAKAGVTDGAEAFVAAIDRAQMTR